MPSVLSVPENVTIDLRADYETIENNIVSKSTTNAYMNTLASIMVFLFETNRDMLHDDLVGKMILSWEKDMREKERLRALPLSNNGKRRRIKKVDPEKNLKALCKNALQETKRTGSEYYCPIKLDGVNGLNYEALRDYMMSKKVVKVINRDVAETALKKCQIRHK